MGSWNDVTKKVREIRKNFVVRCAISFVAVLASALLQSYVILAFIRPAGLLSSGFTGLAILIDRIAELYGFTVSTSLALVVLNLPVALMCCRSINVKFTVFSLLQVFFASFFLKKPVWYIKYFLPDYCFMHMVQKRIFPSRSIFSMPWISLS